MVHTKGLSCFLAVLGTCILTAEAAYLIHEQRDDQLGNDVVRNRVHPDTLLPMRIALRPNNHASSNAEAWLRAVSDPDSSTYGKFWTQEDIIEAFKPSDDTINAVKGWLSSEGIEHITHSGNKQWLAFVLPAKQAEAMLMTKYFERVLGNGRIQISCDTYMLPAELQAHVDFVKP